MLINGKEFADAIRQTASGKEHYVPSPEDNEFRLMVYNHFLLDRNLKDSPQPLMGGRTLKTFWDDSEKDYNNLTDSQGANDPIKPYSSGVTRDKSNIFVTNLSLNLFFPTVKAQNANQEEDIIFSKAARAILEYAHENDGRPAESGHQKFVRFNQKNVVQGTVHVQDDIIDGKLESTLVPNEEILIPNFYQPNIQKQGRLMRVQDNVTYDEAEMEFGGLENFKKYVYPGMSTVFTGMNQGNYQKLSDMIDTQNKCQILRVWYPVAKHKLSELKAKGKLPNYVKRAKYFNIFVNGVKMFDNDNLMPYHDGFYPINKGIFEMFSRPEYYWGNSLANKIREDKNWKDGWKTLIRWKGKMSAIPPLITFNGTFVDTDIVVPGMITEAPAGMNKDDVQTIPGLTKGVDNSDIALDQNADSEIDRATMPPQMSGQTEKGRQTAREVVLADDNAKKILNSFALQIMFFTSARTFPIIMRMFQFKTREEINKISVPNQALPDGTAGNMQIIFFNGREEYTKQELEDREFEIYRKDRASSKRGASRQTIFIRRDYWTEIDLFLTATVESLMPESPAIREAKADMKFNRYSSRPDLFNQQSAARMLVRANGDNEDEMLIDKAESDRKKQEQQQQAEMQGVGKGGGQNPLTKMSENSSGLADDGTTPTNI